MKMTKIIFQRFEGNIDAEILSLLKNTAQDAKELNEYIVPGEDLSDLLNIVQPYLPVYDVACDLVTMSLVISANMHLLPGSGAHTSH